MQIQKLQLENFRNYSSFELDFKKKILLIIGKNAKGKTNLIEALFTLSIGKSFRLKTLDEAIKWDEDYLRIVGTRTNQTELEIFYSLKPRRQKVSKINNVKKNLNDFVGNFVTVLFTPEDIDLVSAAPSLRRRFIDILLSQISHSYLINLINYQKILKQRNKLLKSILEGKSQEDELEFWDMRLAEHGTEVIRERFNFFTETQDFLKKQYKIISGKDEHLTLKYLTKIHEVTPESYLNNLEQRHKRDIITGETSVGPHRDDFEFILNNKALINFGSRGEFRSSVLALKITEVYYIEKTKGEKPLLLLDDVFSELDSDRQKHLIEAIKHQQTIITTTDDTILEIDKTEMQVLEL